MRAAALFADWLCLGLCLGLCLFPGPARGEEALHLRPARPGPPLRLCTVDETGTQIHYVRGEQGYVLSVPERTLRPQRCRLDAAWVGEAESKNERLRVSATADGGLRWSRPDDGRALLAFYPSADGRAFVLVTPTGYFEGAGQGGDELVGWALGPKEDFFPLGLFPGYRAPFVIGRVLLDRDEEVALDAEHAALGKRRAPQEVLDLLPPVVSILDPRPGASISGSRVEVRFEVRSPSGQDVLASARIDGRPAERSRGVAQPIPSGQVRLSVVDNLPRQDVTIAIVASTARSVAVSTRVRLRWVGPRDAAQERPDLHVIAVGVNEYVDPGMRLTYPAKDARDLIEVLRAQEGKQYRKVHPTLLLDQQATREGISRALTQGLDRTRLRQKDVVVLFLAGHGVGNPDLGTYHFVPHDAHLGKIIDAAELQAWLGQIPCKVVLLLDTCHAGSLMGRRNLLERVGADLAGAESGIYVLAASTGEQTAKEAAAYGNGAFTRALLEGLKGAADPGATGAVTITQLDDYVSRRVPQLTGGFQTPTAARPAAVPNFVVAQVPIPWYRRKRYVIPLSVGSALLVAGGVILLSTQIGPPPYDTGNSGWLVGGAR